ncbi:hypothetical protein [Lactobacillus gallinarum]|uniref:hypothetical protein n=1 Tax=Lactobacillus gallinarum TaxID=52242 RepID=UPI00174ABC58|nr:hypothetical protein [Lactobacillus gallinarum]
MAVFELEGNASQDANYREHLNANWLNGNNAFDNIYQQISNWQNLISRLSSRVTTLESENDKRIQENINLRNELTQYEIKTDQRLQRLEAAIFNAEYINDTKSDVEAKPSITHEINDTHVVNDDNGIIIQDEHQTLPNDVN